MKRQGASGDATAAEWFNPVDGKNAVADIRNMLESEHSDDRMFNGYFGTGFLDARGGARSRKSIRKNRSNSLSCQKGRAQ